MPSPVTAIVRTLLRKPDDRLNVAFLLTADKVVNDTVVAALAPHTVISLPNVSPVKPPVWPDLDAVVTVDVDFCEMSLAMHVPFVVVRTVEKPKIQAHASFALDELDQLSGTLFQLCSKPFVSLWNL